MDRRDVSRGLDGAKWVFAKTMANIPHEYTVRNTWEDDGLFVDIVLYIREYGVREKFMGRYYTYLYLGGYKYWTMGNPVSRTNRRKTFIINRARV